MIWLNRIGLEIGGAIVLIVACSIFWKIHNSTEQKLGARECIAGTTETKAEARTDNAGGESKQAGQLAQAVGSYEKQIAGLSATNVDLARRLYAANQVRSNTVPDTGRAACGTGANPGLRESEAANERRRIDTARLLDACDANAAKVIALAQAYESARRLAIAAQDDSGKP